MKKKSLFFKLCASFLLSGLAVLSSSVVASASVLRPIYPSSIEVPPAELQSRDLTAIESSWGSSENLSSWRGYHKASTSETHALTSKLRTSKKRVATKTKPARALKPSVSLTAPHNSLSTSSGDGASVGIVNNGQSPTQPRAPQNAPIYTPIDKIDNRALSINSLPGTLEPGVQVRALPESELTNSQSQLDLKTNRDRGPNSSYSTYSR